MSATKLIDQVFQHVRQTALLQSTIALLEWDQHTKMPAGAAQWRADQIAALAKQIHDRRTDSQLGDWLAEATAELDGGDSQTAVNIRQLKKNYERQTKLPGELVVALARASSEGQTAWVEARKNNDFASFAGTLKLIFDLKREQAQAIGYVDHPYDALIDEYEPGAKTAEVAMTLKGLCDELVPLVAAIQEKTGATDPSILRRTYAVEKQQQFGREVSAEIGFDYDRGRLDVTHHPFCTELGPSDCRITTRYDEQFFSGSFFGTLHEAGHGIYEQGLPADQYGLPLGTYCSLGIHESQSRLWENLVGRSQAFWQHYFSQAQSLFPASLADVNQDDFYKAVNHVQPSLIRVEADEATYNLHIAIRFELETALIKDDLAVADLPAAWNEKYQEYLGITPPSDADGVLQDVHWAAGLVGYFPTYSLGNLYASQFFEAAEAELGELAPSFAKGHFQPLKNWLNQNIHRHGKGMTGPELGLAVTNQPLGHEQLMKHLRSKYSAIYGL
jgi:carboxypeptidase Taq